MILLLFWQAKPAKVFQLCSISKAEKLPWSHWLEKSDSVILCTYIKIKLLSTMNTHDSGHKLINSRFSQKVVFVAYFIFRHHGRRNCRKQSWTFNFHCQLMKQWSHKISCLMPTCIDICDYVIFSFTLWIMLLSVGHLKYLIFLKMWLEAFPSYTVNLSFWE